MMMMITNPSRLPISKDKDYMVWRNYFFFLFFFALLLLSGETSILMLHLVWVFLLLLSGRALAGCERAAIHSD